MNRFSNGKNIFTDTIESYGRVVLSQYNGGATTISFPQAVFHVLSDNMRLLKVGATQFIRHYSDKESGSTQFLLVRLPSNARGRHFTITETTASGSTTVVLEQSDFDNIQRLSEAAKYTHG